MFEYFIKKLNKDNRGFTLIELVIVIAIIGILVAIAVTKMGGTTKKAAISAHNANVRTLESAASMFIADNPGTKVNSSDCQTKLKDYIQEWPTVPKGIKYKNGKKDLGGTNYTVTIKEDGTITVTPGKADENGEVSKDQS
jgi:type IV pilus assembly protein PilA